MAVRQSCRKQAEALEAAIAKRIPNVTFRCFPAMRYWKPWIVAAERAIDWHATDAVLLPLYPGNFSTTTTAFAEGAKPASHRCYPAGGAFSEAHGRSIMTAWRADCHRTRAFSFHGLPQRVVDRGDPYQWQVEQSVAAV
ncbi:MAG: ferrochelatase [Hyphomonadaceae bacterium]